MSTLICRPSLLPLFKAKQLVQIVQGPVVQRFVKANPGLKFNPAFELSLFNLFFDVSLRPNFKEKIVIDTG